jgi:hypothetical protein
MAELHTLVERLQETGKLTAERVAELAGHDIDALLELANYGENVLGGKRGKEISQAATLAIGLVIDM